MPAELYGSALFAVGAGLATFFAPCSYALLPGYVGYYVAATEGDSPPMGGVLARGGAAAVGVFATFFALSVVAVAASGFVEDVERIGREHAATEGGFAVATVGALSVEPGARNVVPGRVTHTIDVRDVDGDVMDGIVADAEKSLARIERERHGIEASLERYRTVDPTPMSDRCRDALSAAAERRGIDAIDLPSGGGHDTMRVAEHADVGMIFVRSRDGISHNPREWSDWDDCAAAADVLANVLVDVAG